MGILEKVWDAVKETLDEFQGGPDRPRKVTKRKRVYSRPKWMDVRNRRIPQKTPKTKKTKIQKKIPKAPKRPIRVVIKRRQRLPPMVIERERAVIAQSAPPESWEQKIEDDDSKLNEVLDEPQQRVERILSEPVKKKLRKNRMFLDSQISKKRKHLLFMNPGTEKIHEALAALTTGQMLPMWAEPFRQSLSVVKGRLMFEDLPMATTEQKREAVKRQYFDPKKASTIQPITDTLRESYANISKGNVQRILRSLETYQRNFGRRRPPKIMGRMSLKNPGIIAMDMFFPTRKIAGWEGKWNCLTCMDCWSRYTHVYALVDKKFATVERAMTMFLQEFASYGFMPRRILCDKGTDLAPAKKVMEKYRTAKDGHNPMVVHTQTAQPVNIVEVMNSEVQRMMQVFRTSDLTDDPSVLLEDISYAINRKKRQARGDLTPIQLLSLSKEERQRVNDLSQMESDIPEVQGLPKLFVGNTVRVLLWSRKDQAKNAFKGFTAKWSKETYTVLRKTTIPRNRNNYRYDIGTNKSYYRHELLKIPRTVDTETIDMVSHRQVYVAPEENWSEEEDWED